jgi:hypothetical protein
MTSQEARTDALVRRADALAKYERTMSRMMSTKRYTDDERAAQREAEQQIDAARQADRDYLAALPRTSMSQCPFCGESLVRTFDPYGLDGSWWRSSAEPEEPQACRHFCVLRGALHFDGQPAKGGDFEAHVGPQAPYVIPRIMELPQVIAVISRIRMANGYLAYPIAYFAERKPPPQDLTCGWPRTNYVYQTQLGEVRWRIPNDPWDFDLRPWLEKGKLRWCMSDTQTFVLSSDPAGTCPFVDLPGEHRAALVKGDECRFEPLPEEQRGT